MGSHARPDWTEQEITLLKQLCDSGLYRFDKLAEKIGRSKSGVMYKCYEQGFNNLYRYHLYTHNKWFFSQITPETCYWAGVITTDGCLSSSPKGGAVLTLVAAIKDRDHVERFKAAIQATNPIGLRYNACALSKRDKQKKYPSCALSIDGAQECTSDLAKTFNITPNKTLRSTPPNLPTLYHRLCFIRGMIDGDGTITSAPSQEGFLHIGLCGCNREMMAWVKDTIDGMNLPSLTNGTRVALLHQPADEHCFYYSIRGLKAAVLWEILQRLPLPRLSRKWDGPRALTNVAYWKARPADWPPETFFAQYAQPIADSVSPAPTVTSTSPSPDPSPTGV